MARLFIVSNRVNVPKAGSPKRAGGLEVALSATLKRYPCVWLGWSGAVKPDEGAVETRTVVRGKVTYVVTDLTKEDYQEYYAGYANSVLWPVLHYRLNLTEFSKRDLTGYLRVNEHFADELHKILEPDDVVWVHDYHLIPFARALRQRGHFNRIGFFLHIPMPPPEILTALPGHEKLIPALRDYDLVGFQTENDAANFARYLAGELNISAHIARPFSTGERSMRIGTFPVGVETEAFNRRARHAARSTFVKKVIGSMPGSMVIGVDRLDYSKGLPHRLEAFERFLAANPAWHGRVNYLQITPKSRSEIQEYADIRRVIDAAAGRINATYGDPSWIPVRYINRTYGRTALAGLYRSARVGLVTSLRDGMNLVSKEYVAAQDGDDPGVLVLSRFAGASAELRAALLVNPYDPEAVGAAIARALEMSRDERIARHAELYATLLQNDIANWGERFLLALGAEALEPDPKAVTPLLTPRSRRIESRTASPRNGKALHSNRLSGAATSSRDFRSAATPRSDSVIAAKTINPPPKA